MSNYTRRTTSVIPTSTGLRELQQRTTVPRIEPVEAFVGVEAAKRNADQLQRYTSQKQDEILREAEKTAEKEQRAAFVRARADVQEDVSRARTAYENGGSYKDYNTAMSEIQSLSSRTFAEGSLEQAELDAAYSVAAINDRARVEAIRRDRQERLEIEDIANRGESFVEEIRNYQKAPDVNWNDVHRGLEDRTEALVAYAEASNLKPEQQALLIDGIRVNASEAEVQLYTEAGQFDLADRVVRNTGEIAAPRARTLLNDINSRKSAELAISFDEEIIEVTSPTTPLSVAARRAGLVELRREVEDSNLIQEHKNARLVNIDMRITALDKGGLNEEAVRKNLEVDTLPSEFSLPDAGDTFINQQVMLQQSGQMGSIRGIADSLQQRSGNFLDEEDAFNTALMHNNLIPDPAWIGDLAFETLKGAALEDRKKSAMILIAAIDAPSVTNKRRQIYLKMADKAAGGFGAFYADTGIADYTKESGVDYNDAVFSARVEEALSSRPEGLPRSEVEALAARSDLREHINVAIFSEDQMSVAMEAVRDAWDESFPDKSITEHQLRSILDMAAYGSNPSSLLENPPASLEDLPSSFAARLEQVVSAYAAEQRLVDVGQSQLVGMPGTPPARDPYVTQIHGVTEYGGESFTSYRPWQAVGSIRMLQNMDTARIKGLEPGRAAALEEFVADLSKNPAFGNASHWDNRVAVAFDTGGPLDRPFFDALGLGQYVSDIESFSERWGLSPSQVNVLFSKENVPQPTSVLSVFADLHGDAVEPYVNAMLDGNGIRGRRYDPGMEIVFNFNETDPSKVFPEVKGPSLAGVSMGNTPAVPIRVDPGASAQFSPYWGSPLSDPEVQKKSRENNFLRAIRFVAPEDRQDIRDLIEAVELGGDIFARGGADPLGVVPVSIRLEDGEWGEVPAEEVQVGIVDSAVRMWADHARDVEMVDVLKRMPHGTMRDALLEREGVSTVSELPGFSFGEGFDMESVLEAIPRGTLRDAALERQRRKNQSE